MIKSEIIFCMQDQNIVAHGESNLSLVTVDVFSESGERLAHCQMNTFVRGAGGYGGHRNSDLAVTTVSTPTRPPDGSITENIGTDQVADLCVNNLLTTVSSICCNQLGLCNNAIASNSNS